MVLPGYFFLFLSLNFVFHVKKYIMYETNWKKIGSRKNKKIKQILENCIFQVKKTLQFLLWKVPYHQILTPLNKCNFSSWPFPSCVSLRADTWLWLTVFRTDRTASPSSVETSSSCSVKTAGDAGEFFSPSAHMMWVKPLRHGGLVIRQTIQTLWKDTVYGKSRHTRGVFFIISLLVKVKANVK